MIKSGKKTNGNHDLNLVVPHMGGQRAIYEHPSRFQIVTCGRRWGKTELGKLIASRCLIRDGGHVAWVSPTSKMAGAVWRVFLEGLSPIADWVSVQEKTIILPNKGKLTLWTAENEDALRGQAFDLVILDEAAMYKSGLIWQAIIRPALSDRQGKAYFLSTPRGRNWFWELYLLGNKRTEHDYQSWNFPSSTSPYFIKSEFEEAKRNLPERFFLQEYLAEFLLDGGEVFKGVVDVAVLGYKEEAYSGNFAFGIDLARQDDYTVVVVMDMETREMVDMLVVNYMAWKDQRREIWNMWEKWKPIIVMAEENSVGSPTIERLQEEGMSIEPFYTTNTSKKEIIDQLTLDIQNQEIWLLNDRDLIAQLQSYQMGRTPTGKIKYSSPVGFHDDIVMALAICNHACIRSNASFGSSIPVIW